MPYRTDREHFMSLVEQVARDELGMVRPGDIVFQFR